MIPLFERFGKLRERIPRTAIAGLPTPLYCADDLGREAGVGKLYVKRDDITGELYGGNKVRKLEFLLGKALQEKAKAVMTFGAAGSNHCLATAVCARKVGLRSISILTPQPISPVVRQNILARHYYGQEQYYYPDEISAEKGAEEVTAQEERYNGIAPMIIPAGGSNPMGICGFINAGLELKQQVSAGKLPEPDYIYCAMGTMGTAVGLTLGLALTGMKSQLMSVRVIDSHRYDEKHFRRLMKETIDYLRGLDSSFPELDPSVLPVNIRDEFLGKGYGFISGRNMEIMEMAKDLENIQLEGTYTVKAMTAVFEDGRTGSMKYKTVLFWNTFSSIDLSGITRQVDYKDLPPSLYSYFL